MVPFFFLNCPLKLPTLIWKYYRNITENVEISCYVCYSQENKTFIRSHWKSTVYLLVFIENYEMIL